MARNRSLTQIEMKSLELLIAVAQHNKRASGHVMVNKEDQALAIATAIGDWRMAGLQLDVKNRKINSRIQNISEQLGVAPTLKNLMDAQAEALKQRK